ncbi:hypothetical protein AGMMS50267_18180 [Spirochaetia bacterium]|nr:hypothetical protein AGMMS50267_18180 [Spirochaetia bacterium]
MNHYYELAVFDLNTDNLIRKYDFQFMYENSPFGFSITGFDPNIVIENNKLIFTFSDDDGTNGFTNTAIFDY